MPVGTANFGELLEPGLRHLYGLTYDQYEPEWTQFMDVEMSDKAFEESLSLAGFGIVPEKDQGASVSFVNPKQGFVNRITNVTYGLGFSVTRELKEDDQYRQINAYPTALATSVNHTREILSANILNNGFDSSVETGADGLELFSKVHLLKGGGTYANEPSSASDLSETSLRQAIIDIEAYVDDEGLLVQARIQKLLVHPNDQFTADQILGSAQTPFDGNNSINPLMARMPWMVGHFLTAEKAWYIKTNVSFGWTYQDRRTPEFTQDNTFDSENAKFKTTFRVGLGWHDPRGGYASPGA